MKINTLTVAHNFSHTTTKVEVEEFETVEEAVKLLGPVQVLKLVNYAHSLSVRSKAHSEMSKISRRKA